MSDHDYVMDFYLMVMLRSTTGSYGRPVIEVAYGEMMLSLHRGCMGMIFREEWLGCRYDALPMFDMLESTPGWAQCILFFGFQDIKTYVYVYYFQNLYVV